MMPTYTLLAFLGVGFLSAQTLIINEVDADSPGADNAYYTGSLYASS